MSDWINQWRQNALSERDSNWWVNESETQLVSEREKVWKNGCASECMNGWKWIILVSEQDIDSNECMKVSKCKWVCGEGMRVWIVSEQGWGYRSG